MSDPERAAFINGRNEGYEEGYQDCYRTMRRIEWLSFILVLAQSVLNVYLLGRVAGRW